MNLQTTKPLIFIIVLLLIPSFHCSRQINISTDWKYQDILPFKDALWTTKHDFNGDKKNDTIYFRVSPDGMGWFWIGFKLADIHKFFIVPINIDTSSLIYLSSGSDIDDFNCDSLPEVFIHANKKEINIRTDNIPEYKLKEFPIADSIKQKYHIKGNNLLIGFKNDSFTIQDFQLNPDSLPPCIASRIKANSRNMCDSGWASRFDFNGDSLKDSIIWSFSGGAHCCYSISILLKGINKRFDFPFQMDGGYLCGLDLSQPHQFNIKDFDGDSIPEIYMLIQTYNNERQEIPTDWKKKYGISKNEILIKFVNNKPVIRDFKKGF